MTRWIAVAAALAVTFGALAACSKKKDADGLPPANQWSADQAGAEMPAQPAPGDPHAGMDMSNPRPGPVDPNGPNPHAGMDMSGGGGGTDVSKLGLTGPDPDRKIDPSHHVRGVITVGAKAKVPAGAVVFLAAKRPGPDGKPVDPALAVDRLTYQGGDLQFELGDAQAMLAGTAELVGDLIVTAHYAQNGDALSKAPGDVIGSVRVKVPADGVKITLDTVLP